MILGQFWYGWAPRGVEGVDQEQIVAGSGNLWRRANALTQKVLPWCYYPKSESRGWIERNGIGVAFRRTPTGRDARGREGAFFVHALVWEAGAVPPALLAGLWDAEVWVTSPPADPPERLEPIRSVEELGISEIEAPDRGLLTDALAGLLQNLAASRKSSLDLAPAQAYAVASRLVAVLPAHFGLISFSTYEEQNRATAYDLVAGAPPGPQHIPIGPATAPPPDLRRAAELLLCAHDGEASAKTLVDLVAEDTSSLSGFAERMRRWAQLETGSPPPGQDLDPKCLALIEKCPGLVDRLMQGEQTREIARRFIAGSQVDRLVEALRHAGHAEPFTAVLREELLNEAPAGAITCLLRLEQWLPSDTRALAIGLAGSWPRTSLRELSPDQAVALAGLIASGDRIPAPAVTAIANDLACIPEFTSSLVAASLLPAQWRARAAAAHPGQIAAEKLVDAIALDQAFACTFVEDSGPRGLRALEIAIEAAEIPLGLACAERAGAYLSSENERLKLLLPVVARLPPEQRLKVLNRYAQLSHVFDESWMDTAIGALVEAVLSAREQARALPRIGGSAFGVELRSSTSRIDAWRRLSGTLSSPGSMQIKSAIHDLTELSDTREWDAAAELLVDWVCERVDRSEGHWFAAVTTLASELTQAGDLARRLARAASRNGRGDRAIIARWTIRWIADGIDRELISSDITQDPAVVDLPNSLYFGDIDTIGGYLEDRRRRAPSRRWLQHVEKTAKKRFGHRRRFVRRD